MAEMMQFDLVAPERRLASMQASEVSIPGAEGDMTAMADHVPMITTLRPGIVSVKGADGTQDFVVTGGFAEITATGASVLAEHAVPRAEVTGEMMAGFLAAAETARSEATAGRIDAANKLVADLVALGEAIRVPAR